MNSRNCDHSGSLRFRVTTHLEGLMLIQRISWTGALVVSLAAVAANAATITIDPNTRYQTIVGFGGCVNSCCTNSANDLINDAGVSCLRIDWCEVTSPNMDATKPFFDAGTPHPTIIGSCWSPPANMKDNNSLNNGGHLLPAQYNAFADYTIQKLQKFRQTFGVELYALSPQNEPAFSEFYPSCIYDGADIVNVTKALGQKIQAAGLKTKLFLPEDLYSNWSADGKYWTPLLQDSVAKRYVSALAFHGNGSDFAGTSALSHMYSMAHSNGWELWQTENADVNGSAPNPPLHTSTATIRCLRYGMVSVYLKYDIVGSSTTEEYYVSNTGARTLTYYLSKCINKFIRPGAVQLRSVSSDSTAMPNFVVFYDRAASAISFTAVTTTAQTITLRAANLPANLQKWIANATTNCVNQGNVSSSSSIDLPANSVVTLYGTGYTPTATSITMPGARSVAGRLGATTERTYDLDGRRSTMGTRTLGAVGRATVVLRDGQAKLRVEGIGN
jgi:O-glycosyl hydrolase